MKRRKREKGRGEGVGGRGNGGEGKEKGKGRGRKERGMEIEGCGNGGGRGKREGYSDVGTIFWLGCSTSRVLQPTYPKFTFLLGFRPVDLGKLKKLFFF